MNFSVVVDDLCIDEASVVQIKRSRRIGNLTDLYVSLGPRLLAYFRQHRSTHERAEDLLQETFMRALRNQDRVERAESRQAYLFGIARHLRLDVLRERPVPEEEILYEIRGAPEEEDPRLDQMRAAIGQLKELHREPLLLKLRHDLSYEEIAQVLKIPVGTVRSRLHHAVADLKTTLIPPGTTNDQVESI